jgi:lysophospholipase L1-like esterase
MSRKLHIGPRTGVLLFFVAVVGLELGLSLFGGWGQQAISVADGRLGWRKLPGQEGVWSNGVAEVINSRGYRDREWSELPEVAPASGGPLRVAVLGDSVAYGHKIEVEEILSRQLEARLREHVAPDAQVMNFAMLGYVFEQMARVWEDDVRAFRPDVLVVTVNAFSARPMVEFEEGPTFPLRDFLLRSAIYDYLNRGLRKDGGFLRVEFDDPEGEVERDALERAVRSNRRMQVDPFSPEHEPRWREMARRIEGLAADCAAVDCRLVLVSMPRLEDVLAEIEIWTGDRWGPWCEARAGVQHVDPLPRFREAMAPLLAALERRKISPRRIWSRNPERRDVSDIATAPATLYSFEDPNHINARGHALLAEAVFEALEQRGEL